MGEKEETYQQQVLTWLIECFGSEIAYNCKERNYRFLEEALELVQACNCTVNEAHLLVDYVYNRPKGEKSQEVGGVMVTLAALCSVNELDMEGAAKKELKRIWTKIPQIRTKQEAKPIIALTMPTNIKGDTP